MLNLMRFMVVIVTMIVAVFLALGVAGMLSASEIWTNSLKVLQLAAIVFVASIVVMLVTKGR